VAREVEEDLEDVVEATDEPGLLQRTIQDATTARV
jgi:hypothetical protein